MSYGDFRSEAAAAYPYATSAGHDHRAWAKRILYRQERGDTLLSALQIRMAQEAMNPPQS